MLIERRDARVNVVFRAHCFGVRAFAKCSLSFHRLFQLFVFVWVFCSCFRNRRCARMCVLEILRLLGICEKNNIPIQLKSRNVIRHTNMCRELKTN